MVGRIAPALLCTVVALAPLPFGSAEPFWAGIWCTLLALAILSCGRIDASRPLRGAIVAVLVVVAAWCVVVVLQFAPAEWKWIGIPHPAWGEAGRLLTDHVVVPRIAAVGAVPIAALAPPLALVLALLAGLVMGSDPATLVRVYHWAANAGLAYAAYGIFAEVTNPGLLLWHVKTAYVNSVTGTFVNHNTAATFFGAIAIIWYARALRELRQTVNLARMTDLAYLAYKLKSLQFRQVRHGLYFVVVLATTIMTKSRAGAVLTLAGLGLVTILYFAGEIKRGKRALLGLFALAAVGMVVLEAVGGQLAHQIETRGLADPSRIQAYRSSLAVIHDFPWLGTGLGSFPDVFPAYRTAQAGVWGVWDHAHSTPLELMVEMGIPFSLLVFALWAAMLALLLRAALGGTGNRIYVIAATAIGLVATLHSMVDFSLQIPGFSIVCGALMGASLASILAPPADAPLRRHRSEAKPSQSVIAVPPGTEPAPVCQERQNSGLIMDL